MGSVKPGQGDYGQEGDEGAFGATSKQNRQLRGEDAFAHVTGPPEVVELCREFGDEMFGGTIAETELETIHVVVPRQRSAAVVDIAERRPP